MGIYVSSICTLNSLYYKCNQKFDKKNPSYNGFFNKILIVGTTIAATIS